MPCPRWKESACKAKLPKIGAETATAHAHARMRLAAGKSRVQQEGLWSSPEDLRVALDQLLLGVQHHLLSWRESEDM